MVKNGWSIAYRYYSLDYVEVYAATSFYGNFPFQFTKINKSGKSGSLYLNSIEIFYLNCDQQLRNYYKIYYFFHLKYLLQKL